MHVYASRYVCTCVAYICIHTYMYIQKHIVYCVGRSRPQFFQESGWARTFLIKRRKKNTRRGKDVTLRAVKYTWFSTSLGFLSLWVNMALRAAARIEFPVWVTARAWETRLIPCAATCYVFSGFLSPYSPYFSLKKRISPAAVFIVNSHPIFVVSRLRSSVSDIGSRELQPQTN